MDIGIPKRLVLINASMSVVQVVAISGTFFVLYRLLLDTIGVEQLGIWSLVLATTSFAQIANLGISGGIVKFVAKYVARSEVRNVYDVIQTAVISIGILVGVVLCAGYPFIKWVLLRAVPDSSAGDVVQLLPYSVLSLWLGMVTGVFQSGLDGFQKIYIRNFLNIGNSALYALSCVALAPRYGLIGLAYAQVITSVVMLIVSWISIKKYLPELPIIPHQWNTTLFKEIIAYGVNFQVMSVVAMLCDPITKVFLGKFGGLSMVGYFDMANKMLQQFRALIVSANQVLVPAIAGLQETTPKKIHSVYLTSYRLLFYLSFPLYSLAIISLPTISRIWIGRYEGVFVVFGTMLGIGWLLNILNAPAYFSYLGIGDLRWNVISHLTAGLLNAGLGYTLGTAYGGIGVVWGWVVSLALGSSVPYVAYHLSFGIPLRELVPRASRMLMGVCCTGVLLENVISHRFGRVIDPLALNGALVGVFAVMVVTVLWLHPMRKQLFGWVRNEMVKTKATT